VLLSALPSLARFLRGFAIRLGGWIRIARGRVGWRRIPRWWVTRRRIASRWVAIGGVARWVKSAIAWRPGVRIVGICRRVAIGTVGRLRSIISALIVSSIRIRCPAMIPQHKESGNKNIHKRHPKLFCCEEKQTKTNGGCSTANCVLPTVGAPCPRVIDTLQ